MMRSETRSRLSLVAVALAVFTTAGAARAAEFSADFVEKVGKRTVTGKVYVQGYKIRRDIAQGTQKGAIIYRLDKKVAWLLNPAQKAYLEVPAAGAEFAYSSPDDPKVQAAIKAWGKVKKVGKGTVAGYPCDKYLFVFHDKSAGTQHQWVSQKLKVPLRIEHKAGEFSALVEYKNIKEGKVAASLFELPKGYKKVAATAPPTGRGQRPGMRRGR